MPLLSGDREGRTGKHDRESGQGGPHRWKIPAIVLLVAATACGGPQFGPDNQPDPVNALPELPPQPLDQVLILEQSGISPGDTTVRFAAGRGRTVLMRHAPPDNAIFAIVDIPPDSGATDSVTITLRPVPGRYGVRVTATPRLPAGARVTFSYAVHFQAPPLDNSRYRGEVHYSQWLGVGRLGGTERLRFQPYSRPAADMVRSDLPEVGEYLVAAPR